MFYFFKKNLKQIQHWKYFLTVCYHVTYAFLSQTDSEFTLFSCLNAKELLARNKRDILSLSDSNGTRNHNHLPRNWTLNHLAKLATYIFYFIWAYRFLKFSVWMA